MLRLLVEHRCQLSIRIKEKLQKLTHFTVIYTTRKLKTCLPSLKFGSDQHLKLHLVNEKTRRECKSTYIGQTCRHITTRMAVLQKKDSPVGQHLRECFGTSSAIDGV